MTRSTRGAARALAALAHEQGGYFTAKQAQEVGYGYRHLDYHETAGNFERVGHWLIGHIKGRPCSIISMPCLVFPCRT